MLSEFQKSEILKMIEQKTLFFIASFGAEVITEQDKMNLRSLGFDLSQVTAGANRLEHAFKFGMLSEVLGEAAARRLTYSQFLEYLENNNFLPLNEIERGALRLVKRRGYQDIKGLGNRVAANFEHIFIEQDQLQRANMERLIRREAASAVEKRKTAKQLASNLGNLTQDWARDFDRIADYIMHSAYENGRASSIMRKSGSNSEVYFDVFPQACNHCVRLYLTAGPGSEPKIFKLTDILANGSNIGKKAKDWKPVLPPVHPFCRCSMNEKKPDMAWDEENRSFTKPVRNQANVNRTSKVKIKTNF